MYLRKNLYFSHELLTAAPCFWDEKNKNEKLKEIFVLSPFKMIDVYCPLEICRQRNIERGDRKVNQSEEQFSIMSKNVIYDITVDTSIYKPEKCAELILENIFKIVK